MAMHDCIIVIVDRYNVNVINECKINVNQLINHSKHSTAWP